ncbi:hypothetical protein ACFWDQ_20755 [Streptomyces sp. NPDC060053]|uniref:hypothetical protein n=1 Tax=Streptomyces sp. NPDC060053 TaxID=3347047 RepID=UPI00369657A2
MSSSWTAKAVSSSAAATSTTTRPGTATCASGGRAALAEGRIRLEKEHRRQLVTVVGPVTITRCALRAPGLPNCYPADQVLGLPRERHSLGLRRLVVLEAVRGSYDHALEAIERRCGARAVGKRQAEQLVRAAAVDIADFYAARTPNPAASTTLLVLSVDGKGIVMRPGHLREATRKAAERATRTFRTRLSTGEKTCRKRMATLAVVHDADPAPRRPHDIIAPPGGRTTRRTPRARGPRPARNGSPPRFNTTRTRSLPPRSTRHKPVTRSTAGAGWSWSTAPPTSSNCSKRRQPDGASPSMSSSTSSA